LELKIISLSRRRVLSVRKVLESKGMLGSRRACPLSSQEGESWSSVLHVEADIKREDIREICRCKRSIAPGCEGPVDPATK